MKQKKKMFGRFLPIGNEVCLQVGQRGKVRYLQLSILFCYLLVYPQLQHKIQLSPITHCFENITRTGQRFVSSRFPGLIRPPRAAYLTVKYCFPAVWTYRKRPFPTSYATNYIISGTGIACISWACISCASSIGGTLSASIWRDSHKNSGERVVYHNYLFCLQFLQGFFIIADNFLQPCQFVLHLVGILLHMKNCRAGIRRLQKWHN